MTRRWRPSLALVLGGALAGTLAVSFVGLVVLRYLGPVVGFRTGAVVVALGITAVTALIGWLMLRLLLRPLKALALYARAQEHGATQDPPRHFGTVELHDLAGRVVSMAEALKDRESSLRAYSDHITHELKSPVTTITAALELLEDAPEAERPRFLAQIEGANREIQTRLEALQDAARARETRYLGTSDLREVVAGLEPSWPDLTLTLSGTGHVPLAPEGLALVLGHLIRNAVEHDATTVDLRLQGRELWVQDNGSGVSPGNAPHLFEPFFTTRRAQGGTGMGLTILRTILRAHRADIHHVASDRGACWRLEFDL